MNEMIWGMISVFCLLGMGFVIGFSGAYSRYLNASAKMIEKMDKIMDECMEIYKHMIES